MKDETGGAGVSGSTIPIVMVRNEEYWIEAVLRPLVAAFPLVLLGDTGSTDDTVRLAHNIPGVDVIEMGEQTPQQLGQVRAFLGRIAAKRGANWCFLVDGDELYCAEMARWIAQRLEEQPPADGRRAGFTTSVTVDGEKDEGRRMNDETPDHSSFNIHHSSFGDLWLLNDRHNRNSIYPAGDAWVGVYPFESPESYGHPAGFFYLDAPPGLLFHAVHLHRMPRSRQDARVFMRQEKQFQFCLADLTIPRTERFDLAGWLQR